MKTSHRIRIFGRDIQVKSSAPAESVRKIEDYLNERATEVAVSLPNADQQLIALLVLLNITESYLADRRDDSNTDTGFQAALDCIVAKIDTALGA